MPTWLLWLAAVTSPVHGATERSPWDEAYRKGPMAAAETKTFCRELATFVFNNHLKKNPRSQQRGMIYEYLDVTRRGRLDQFIQGECLDTMHDGAWFCAALDNAFRATGDRYHNDFLVQWPLPFYLKMLNHSDELYTTRGAVARPSAGPWDKPWAFQEGEKGFIPYFWDDGGSVSLERRHDKNPLPIRPSQDFLRGKPNPRYLLDGYSLGMSNHMAQDIGVMVQLAWLMLRDSREPRNQKLCRETAEAARHLHECRMRHFGFIPMCAAPTALANRDLDLLKRLPDPESPNLWKPNNHYIRALRSFQPGKPAPMPGFMDGVEYLYYYSMARTGGKLPRPLAFKLIYDAYTEPLLYRYYSDDAPVPPGINKSEAALSYVNGKPQQYRSDRKGPHGKPFPIGPRMGCQNMVVCGWALQALRAYPGIWDEPRKRAFAGEPRVFIHDTVPGMKQLPPPKPTDIAFGDVRLALISSRRALAVRGVAPWAPTTITIFARPDGKGTHATVSIRPERSFTVVNHEGKMLAARGEASRKDGALAFRVELPYTATKGQGLWANGCEHCRYSIRVGDQTRNFYLASSEAQVKAWLERELGCGLRTWKAIFDHMGYIPCAINSWGFWDRVSDSGGYAHLVSAAAQWLLYLAGKNDWSIHDYPTWE